MAGRILLFFLLTFLVFYTDQAEVPSLQEYQEMKNYLVSRNKPGVKNFTDEYGVVFDCVDILKQPALDHTDPEACKIPKLLEPDFGRDENKSKASSMKTESSDEVCPVGTVPIRRIQMEELLRAGSVSNFLRGGYGDNKDHAYAYERVTGGVYLGTKATFNIWQPEVVADKKQSFSLAQIWLGKGEGEEKNVIEAGWHVYPNLYKTTEEKPEAVRLFTYFTGDGYQTGHYNQDRMVRLSEKWYPDMVLPRSQFGGDQKEITIELTRGTDRNDWYLIMKMDGEEEWVGCWPQELFSSLATGGAERVSWGGEVTKRREDGASFPAMGSGRFPNQDYTKSAYVKRIYIVNEQRVAVDIPEAKDLNLYESHPDCFKVEDKGNDLSDGGYRRHFLYGGPGEDSCPEGSSISDA